MHRRRHAEVIAVERFAVAAHRPQPSSQLGRQRHRSLVVSVSRGDLQHPGVEAIQCLTAFAFARGGIEHRSRAVDQPTLIGARETSCNCSGVEGERRCAA